MSRERIKELEKELKDAKMRCSGIEYRLMVEKNKFYDEYGENYDEYEEMQLEKKLRSRDFYASLKVKPKEEKILTPEEKERIENEELKEKEEKRKKYERIEKRWNRNITHSKKMEKDFDEFRKIWHENNKMSDDEDK